VQETHSDVTGEEWQKTAAGSGPEESGATDQNQKKASQSGCSTMGQFKQCVFFRRNDGRKRTRAALTTEKEKGRGGRKNELYRRFFKKRMESPVMKRHLLDRGSETNRREGLQIWR